MACWLRICCYSGSKLSAVSDEDRARWDEKYATLQAGSAESAPHLPAVFEPFAEVFPATGFALDLACGRGGAALWFARRGLSVRGLDVSPTAIGQAEALARAWGVADVCHFEVVDLGDGLPAGPQAEVVTCLKYREPRLDQAILARLRPGGLLAISALSEVGAGPGRFRVRRGELTQAFGSLEVIGSGEGQGLAWLLARRW